MTEVDVHVVALTPDLKRVHQIYPAVVRSAGSVPCQSGFGINGPLMLGWNKVETADVGIDYEDAVAKSGRSHAVGIDVHKDFATALSTFVQRAYLHDLTPTPNWDEIPNVIQVSEKEVAEFVEREARITAGSA